MPSVAKMTLTSAGTIDKRLTGGFSSLQKRPQASTSRLRGMGGGWSLATASIQGGLPGTGIGPVLLAGADGLDTVAGSGLDTVAGSGLDTVAGSGLDTGAAAFVPKRIAGIVLVTNWAGSSWADT